MQVQGLNGCTFNDMVAKSTSVTTTPLSITQEVDRVYPSVSNNTLALKDTMVLIKENFKDVVVWNPWAERAKNIADFEDEEYREMICVEVGNVAELVTVEADGHASSSQTLVCW